MKKFLLCLMLAFVFCSPLQASDFSYAEYIQKKLDQSEFELAKYNGVLLFESDLRDCTEGERHLYWCGVRNALEDVRHSKSHHDWVEKNNLVWNGFQWVPR